MIVLSTGETPDGRQEFPRGAPGSFGVRGRWPFHPLTVRVRELVAEDDRAVARVVQSGTHCGTHPRMPEPTGRNFEIEASWLFTLAGARSRTTAPSPPAAGRRSSRTPPGSAEPHVGRLETTRPTAVRSSPSECPSGTIAAKRR
ncbi:predicted protein [Streptomyces sp. C]|nr:predicted protein [Streptomyces sp. C]